jgi:hypothetical protein
MQGLNQVISYPQYVNKSYAQPIPPFFQRLTGSVSGGSGIIKRVDCEASTGILTSNRAPVGQEPIHERQPTHCDATTTIGLFLCVRNLGLLARGNSASNGQCGMHKSQPVQSDSVMATIDCPMKCLGGCYS